MGIVVSMGLSLLILDRLLPFLLLNLGLNALFSGVASPSASYPIDETQDCGQVTVFTIAQALAQRI